MSIDTVLEQFDFSTVYAVRRSLGDETSIFTLTRLAEGLLRSLSEEKVSNSNSGFLAVRDEKGTLSLMYVLASSQVTTEVSSQPQVQTEPLSTEDPS